LYAKSYSSCSATIWPFDFSCITWINCNIFFINNSNKKTDMRKYKVTSEHLYYKNGIIIINKIFFYTLECDNMHLVSSFDVNKWLKNGWLKEVTE